MTHHTFRRLVTTTCIASVLFAAAGAYAQEATPPALPMPPVPEIPQDITVPSSPPVPGVTAKQDSKQATVPNPEFDNFEEDFTPKEDATKPEADAASDAASEVAPAPTEAEIDSLLKEMSVPSSPAAEEESTDEAEETVTEPAATESGKPGAESSTKEIPEVPMPAGATIPEPLEMPAPPVANVADKAIPEEAVEPEGEEPAPEAPPVAAPADTPAVKSAEKPASVEKSAKAAAKAPVKEDAETPPPAELPAAKGEDTEDDVDAMSQEARDAEIKDMLSEIKESGEMETEELKEAPAARPARVPDFLYNKHPDKENEHLYPVYKPEDLDLLLIKESTEGNLNGVQALLGDGRDVNYRAKGGTTPLLAATHSGHKHMVRLLIMRGADANLADDRGVTPLHLAAARGDITIMDSLLDAGAELDAADRQGATPLQVAAAAGQTEAARLLILKGASPDAANNNGQAPLHVAAARNDEPLARLLLGAKANPRAVTASGLTPSAIATQKGYTDLAREIDSGSGSYTAAQQDVIEAQKDASGNVVWAAPAPSPAVIPAEDLPQPGALKDGKWYRDKESWKTTWFKFGGERPQKGENAAAEDGWKYSQDSEGRWWIYDGVHVKYALLPQEEQKRWNTLLNGWIDANEDFDKLTLDQKREWNEKRKILQLVFTEHFAAQTAEDKVYLESVLAKWEALDATAMPAERIEVGDVPAQEQVPVTSPESPASPETAKPVAGAKETKPASTAKTAGTPVEKAAVATPKSMQKDDAQATPQVAETGKPAADVAGPVAEAPIVAPVPPLPDLPAPTASKSEVAAASAAAQQQIDTLNASSPATKDLPQKIADQAKLSGATVTPETGKQLEVLQMIGEWETVDEARASLSPAQRAEAETRRQQIKAKVMPGGSHETAFATMPEPLQEQFKASMKTWDKAEAAHAPLPDYYSTDYATKPASAVNAASIPITVAPAPTTPAPSSPGDLVFGKPEDIGLPQSMRWTKAHPDVIPAWQRPLDIPAYVKEAEPVPAVKFPEMGDLQAEKALPPLDPGSASPEKVREMLRATEELKRVIRALQALKGLLEPQQ